MITYNLIDHLGKIAIRFTLGFLTGSGTSRWELNRGFKFRFIN